MYGRYSTGGFELFMEFKGDPRSTLFSVFKFDLNTMEWYDGYFPLMISSCISCCCCSVRYLYGKNIKNHECYHHPLFLCTTQCGDCSLVPVSRDS